MKLAVKWGIVLGGAVCVWTVGLHLLGFYTTNLKAGQVADAIAILLPVAVIWLAIGEYGRTHPPPSFWKLMLMGVATGLVSVPITAGFFWLYHHFVNPEWLDLLVAFEQEKLTARGASADETAARVAVVRASGTDQAQLIGAVVGTVATSFILSLPAAGFAVYRRRRPGKRLCAVITLAITVAAAEGCTSYRIIRHREPDARNQRMFPARVVGHAHTPFRFAKLPGQRADLDTVTVRAAGGRRVPFSAYLVEHDVLAFLVIRSDTILYEAYRDGMSDSTIHNTFSVAKSVLSALVGIAIGESKIRSVDDPIAEYVAEFRKVPALSGVTIRHLLEMKSGLRYTRTGRGVLSDFRSDEARAYYAADLKEFLLHVRREHEPGTVWAYKDTDAELLGWVLSRAVGMSVSAYTESRLWRRIGTEHGATWSLDHDGGMDKVSHGFSATARDLARLGRLFLEGGAWEGERVVPAEWVERSTSVDSSRTEPEVSTWWKMQHTLYWWHAIQPPHGDFFAEGSRGQRLYVDPRTNTIIVQLANQTRQDFPFRKIVAHLSGQEWEYPRSIPALVREAALAYGPDSARGVFERALTESALAPERYVITLAGMTTVGASLADVDSTRAAGIEVLRLTTQTYPTAAPAFRRLADAYRASGDTARARIAAARAAAIEAQSPP